MNLQYSRQVTRALIVFILTTLLFSIYLYTSISNDILPFINKPLNNSNKSIKILFKHIDKYEKSLKKSLHKDEIEYYLSLRAKNIQIEQDNDAKTTPTVENNSEEAYYIQEEPINRTTLVKLIKLDKYLLKKRSNSLKTIEKVVRNSFNSNEKSKIWSNYYNHINELSLPGDTSILERVLHDLSTRPIISCTEKERGTQIKLVITFDDNTQAIVKPMKLPRDYVTPDDHFYFVDMERHYAEIASYHVDRLLGFNRVPPTVGRIFNITRDFWQKADASLEKTFFYSPVGNTCFTGHCSYYCDTTHATCGKPLDHLEGSTQLMLPRKAHVNWLVVRHPFKRTYNRKRKAEWETNENYCEEQVLQNVYMQSKNILDLVDMSIFDFIIGNMDRHHYEKIVSLGNDSFSLHLDNGRAFGKPHVDELSILAPLTQCCLFRHSTYTRLKRLHFNEFSKLLDESLKKDPLYPILTQSNLLAVDRRLERVFQELEKCLLKHVFVPDVIVDDGY